MWRLECIRYLFRIFSIDSKIESSNSTNCSESLKEFDQLMFVGDSSSFSLEKRYIVT